MIICPYKKVNIFEIGSKYTIGGGGAQGLHWIASLHVRVYTTGSSKTAHELRERFLFKIVPMLNPDGVIVGNTRYGTLSMGMLLREDTHKKKCFF